MKTAIFHNVHAAATENSLVAFIRAHNFEYVTSSDIYLPRRPIDGSAQGFAYVRFQTEEDALAAVKRLNGALYKNDRLRVRLSKTEFAVSSRQREQSAITESLPFAEPPAPKSKKPLVDQHGHDSVYWIRLRESWRKLEKAQTSPLHQPDKDASRTLRDRRAARKAA